MHINNTNKVRVFILKMLRQFPMAIAVMTVVVIINSIDLSLRPYILKIIFDKIADNPQELIFSYVTSSVIFYLFLSVLMASISRVYGYFIEIKMIPNLRKNISHSCFNILLDQSPSYYQTAFSGSLANKVNDLTNNIPEIVQIFFDRFFSNTLTLVIAAYTLCQVNIKFALLMITWVTLLVLGSIFFSKRIAHLSSIWSELNSNVTGKMVDVFSNILSVLAFSRKKQEEKVFCETLDEVAHAETNLQWYYFWIWGFYGYLFIIIQGLNFYLLMKGRERGLISVGDFVLVLTINIAIVDLFWNFARQISQFSKLFGRVSQALSSIVVTPEIKDKKGAKQIQVLKGEIVFDNVQFFYKGADPLYQNKSVTISSGQKVGLVGFSGGGKSTFANLILRFFDVTSGRILIDGQDIRDITQTSLRDKIGMIHQDPSLFHRTLMENIRYGKLEATDEEVVEAAKKAYAHEFISVLPHGYNSLVGERGIKLSGGQRQRVEIARIILKNPPILILDEATSQLDSVTESYIQRAIWQLIQGKTTIVIAHRLSTLTRMDRILVFDKGMIVEDGTHLELLARNGLYKTFWSTQLGGFMDEEVRQENINMQMP